MRLHRVRHGEKHGTGAGKETLFEGRIICVWKRRRMQRLRMSTSVWILDSGCSGGKLEAGGAGGGGRGREGGTGKTHTHTEETCGCRRQGVQQDTDRCKLSPRPTEDALRYRSSRINGP
ncbi:hypothetical protein Q8A73_002020 [Channa argus]|nr:hypothetical protein Q8A73_002020 [Channa argus]